MSDIKLNTVGKIVGGDNLGWFILIEHDPDGTGGYYIYQSPIREVKSSSEGFDDWLEKYEDIDGYFEESGWEINWL
jgi:hypothetical protein